MFRINARIAQRTAARLTAKAVGIAKLIAARDAEKRHINRQFAALDQLYATAVGVDLHRVFHQAGGDLLAQLAAQTGGVDLADHAIFNMLDQRPVGVDQRTGCQGQIAKAHFRQRCHDHVDHFVTAAKRVVERNGHAVLQAGATDCRFQRVADFTLALFCFTGQPRTFRRHARIRGQSFRHHVLLIKHCYCLFHLVPLNHEYRKPRAPPLCERGR